MAKIFYFISEIDEKETYSKNKLSAGLFLVKKTYLSYNCRKNLAHLSHVQLYMTLYF